MNFYNEFDNDIATCVSGLIAAGLVPNGHVDTRSIVEVTPADLAGYAQCHFFAGIGGWSRALEIAGWPADRPVWTGSCPCQPFSVAGKGEGAKDERHLWPVWFKLIEACRPECLFGEQVASPAARDWYDGVCSDLESIGYTCGAVIVGAHSAGADHQRQRLYWMAYSESEKPSHRGVRAVFPKSCESCENASPMVQSGIPGLEGHAGHGDGSHEPGRIGTESPGSTAPAGAVGGVGDTSGRGLGVVGDAARTGSGRHVDSSGDTPGDTEWSDSYPILCRDGKYRRVPSEPSLFPLADGVSSRDMEQVRSILQGMGYGDKEVKRMLREPRSLVALAGRHRRIILHGAGNAIVPEIAAEFIKVAMEVMQLSELTP